jgi:hypothetical protein
MPALNPADCRWVQKDVRRERDINGTMVATLITEACVTNGHLGHERTRAV